MTSTTTTSLATAFTRANITPAAFATAPKPEHKLSTTGEAVLNMLRDAIDEARETVKPAREFQRGDVLTIKHKTGPAYYLVTGVNGTRIVARWIIKADRLGEKEYGTIVGEAVLFHGLRNKIVVANLYATREQMAARRARRAAKREAAAAA